MDIEDPGIEAEAEKETTSNPNTNSSLVVTEQAGDRDMENSRNGKRILGDKESLPRRSQMETNAAGPTNKAQVTLRSTPVVNGTDSIRLGSHGPNIVPPITTSRLLTPIKGRRQSGLERCSDDVGPILTGLDGPPGTYTLTCVGHEYNIRRDTQHGEPSLSVQGPNIHPTATHGSMETDS